MRVLDDDHHRYGCRGANEHVAYPLEDLGKVLGGQGCVAAAEGRNDLTPGPQCRDARIFMAATPYRQQAARIRDVGGLLGQPGLADTRLALDDDVPGPAGPQLGERVDEDLPRGVAPDEGRPSGRRHGDDSRSHPGRRRAAHRAGVRLTAQDRHVQIAQGRAGLQAQLLVEQVAHPSIALESIRGPAGPVQSLG